MLITAFTRFITLLFICVMCAAPAAFAQSFVIGTPLNNPLSGHTATTLSDGSVVVIGLQVEIYDSVTATWAVMAPMNVTRSGHQFKGSKPFALKLR